MAAEQLNTPIAPGENLDGRLHGIVCELGILSDNTHGLAELLERTLPDDAGPALRVLIAMANTIADNVAALHEATDGVAQAMPRDVKARRAVPRVFQPAAEAVPAEGADALPQTPADLSPMDRIAFSVAFQVEMERSDPKELVAVVMDRAMQRVRQAIQSTAVPRPATPAAA